MNIDLNKVNIAIANTSDLNGLSALFAQLIPDRKPEMVEMQLMLNNLKTDCNKIYTATFNNLIVGTAQLIIYENLIRVPQRKGMIDSVIVDKDYRNCGVGAKLIGHILEEAKKQNIIKLYLYSGYHRQKSYQFYKKLGFYDSGLCFEYDL